MLEIASSGSQPGNGLTGLDAFARVGQHAHEVAGKGAPYFGARHEAHEVADLDRGTAVGAPAAPADGAARARRTGSARRQLEYACARADDEPLGNVQPLSLVAFEALQGSCRP